MVVQLGLAFLSGEKESDYSWAVAQLRSVMMEYMIQEPVSVVTDRELALIKCIDTQFSGSCHLLCRWHVNMNVLAKTKKFFPAPIKGEDGITRRHPQFKAFMSDWICLLNSSSLQEYTTNLKRLRTHPRGAINYVKGAWLQL